MSMFHSCGDKCLNFCFCVFKEIGKVSSCCGSGDLSLGSLQLRFRSNLPWMILCQICVHHCVGMHTAMNVCISTLVCKCVYVHANCYLSRGLQTCPIL